jgi:hypothetical protein
VSVLRPLLPSTSSSSRLPCSHPLQDKPICIYIKILESMVVHRLSDQLNALGIKYFSFSFIYMDRLHVSALFPCTQLYVYHRLRPVRVIRLCRLISFRAALAFSCTGLLIISVHSLMRSISFTAHHPTYSGSTS